MKGFTMIILPGEFWIAEIPFTGGVGSKKRPVLVLWLDGKDVVVAAVTSAKPRSLMDVALGEWAESGLRVASAVRLSRLDCLERSLLLGRVGRIGSSDATLVKAVWDSRVKPQF
jgi:mRNA interferase MazF